MTPRMILRELREIEIGDMRTGVRPTCSGWSKSGYSECIGENAKSRNLPREGLTIHQALE
jgi:hypothetical protein